MYEFKLPDLGEGIHEGEVLKWHVAVGETIGEDEPLVDVETDKAAVTIPSPKGGVLKERSGEEGDTVEVGQVIAVIDEGGEAGGDEAPAEDEQKAAEEKKSEAKESEEEESAEKKSEEKKSDDEPAKKPAPSKQPPQQGELPEDLKNRRVTAAPATRRLAREMGVDIRTVPGTGPAGRITPDDVRRVAEGDTTPLATAPRAEGGEREEAPAASAPVGDVSGIPFLEVEALPDFSSFGPVERESIRSIRRKVAKKMTTSMILVPHVALMDDADVSDLESFRKDESERRGDEPGGKLSLLPFVAKAVTRCLQEFPMFNASIDPHREEIVKKGYYGVGIAVDTPRGLMVPVVRDTDRKSIVEISASIVDLATKGRDGSIEAQDFQGGTFTITNIGPIGGKGLIPTINYPEVAILGMGRAERRPVVVGDDGLEIRTMLPLTLTFDHRIADGADAARFMKKLVGLLERPLSWLVEV